MKKGPPTAAVTTPTGNSTGARTVLAKVSEAIRKVNGNVEDVPRLLDALRKTRFESPQGLFRLDEKQNAVIDLHIRRVEKVGGKLVNVYLDKIPDVDQFWSPPQQ